MPNGTGTGSPLQVTIGAPDPCAWDFDKWIAHGEQPTIAQRMQKALCEAENLTPTETWAGAAGAAVAAGLLISGLEFLLPLGVLAGIALLAEEGAAAALDDAKKIISNPLVIGGAALAAGWYLAPAGFLVGAAARRRRRRRA